VKKVKGYEEAVVVSRGKKLGRGFTAYERNSEIVKPLLNQ
jgi:hypothetical protein